MPFAVQPLHRALVVAGTAFGLVGYGYSATAHGLGAVEPNKLAAAVFTPAAQPAPPRWKISEETDAMTDRTVVTAISRVRSREAGVYELSFALTGQEQLETSFAIFDAEPAGIEFPSPFDRSVQQRNSKNVFFRAGTRPSKTLQVRFDSGEPVSAKWSASDEFINAGTVTLGNTVAQQLALNVEAVARLTKIDAVTPPAQTLTPGERLERTIARTAAESFLGIAHYLSGSNARVLIQGLRSADEYIEFPLDGSFEPFRDRLRTAFEFHRRALAERVAHDNAPPEPPAETCTPIANDFQVFDFLDTVWGRNLDWASMKRPGRAYRLKRGPSQFRGRNIEGTPFIAGDLLQGPRWTVLFPGRAFLAAEWHCPQ